MKKIIYLIVVVINTTISVAQAGDSVKNKWQDIEFILSVREGERYVEQIQIPGPVKKLPNGTFEQTIKEVKSPVSNYWFRSWVNEQIRKGFIVTLDESYSECDCQNILILNKGKTTIVFFNNENDPYFIEQHIQLPKNKYGLLQSYLDVIYKGLFTSKPLKVIEQKLGGKVVPIYKESLVVLAKKF